MLQFGTVRELTGTDYCEVVDLAPKEANVVVYIYEPLIRVSTRLVPPIYLSTLSSSRGINICIRLYCALL